MSNRVGYEIPDRLLKKRAIDLGALPDIAVHAKNNTRVRRCRPVEFLYFSQFQPDIDSSSRCSASAVVSERARNRSV